MCPLLCLVRNKEQTEEKDQLYLKQPMTRKTAENPSEFCVTIFLKVAPLRKCILFRNYFGNQYIMNIKVSNYKKVSYKSS